MLWLNEHKINYSMKLQYSVWNYSILLSTKVPARFLIRGQNVYKRHKNQLNGTTDYEAQVTYK